MFKILSSQDDAFNQYEKLNMGFKIIELLNWKTYTDFENDMLSLN